MYFKKNIFIIDNEKNDIVKLLLILDSLYNVYSENNPSKAIDTIYKLLPSKIPDIILISAEVVKGLGSNLINSLKNDNLLNKIPIILTGYNKYGEEEKYLEMGVNDFITRPYTPAILKLRINNLIKMVSLIEENNRLSKTDQLTNISNRRGFDEHLDLIWFECLKNSIPLGFLIIDLDYFKKYNDTYGHLNGDKCLVKIAETIKKSIKTEENHFLARWGGEEFVVLLKGEDLNSTMKIAELIRKNIENTIIKIENNKSTNITVSIGINHITPSKKDSIRDFVSAADISLYKAKSLGRNKVIF